MAEIPLDYRRTSCDDGVMNTTPRPDPRIDGRIDLDFLFGEVHASILGDDYASHVGAHVTIDGNVIADTGLTPLDPDARPIDKARAVRRAASLAILRARSEIGLRADTVARQAVDEQVARLLPLKPFADATWGADLGYFHVPALNPEMNS